MRLEFIASALLIASSASAQPTPGEAYWKAAEFLRAEGASGWESLEAQPVLLGEAIAGDPLAAGPRSTTLLASLELASVDARSRRAATLGALMLNARNDGLAVLNIVAQSPEAGVGVDVNHLASPLDTSLAIQALGVTGFGGSSLTKGAVADLVSRQLATGLWPLLRAPDASGGGGDGDVATTAQAVLGLRLYQGEPNVPSAIANAAAALSASAPTEASDRALRLLALLEVDPAAQQGALDQLAAMQHADGSFGGDGTEPALDRVYATALAARAIWRAGQGSFSFDSDGDGMTDDVDPDSDNDGVCDPGEADASCSGADAFPTDPGETADLDLDGIGDEADLDDDGDGILDVDETGFADTSQEFQNTDGDALADTADPDDDNDGILDVDELLAGLDPRDVDTDGDSFRDNLELAAGTDGANPLETPLPDGDVFPLGAPDGVVDVRDELLAHRILRGLETLPGGLNAVFLLHADVSPLDQGAPDPSGAFDASDVAVIAQRVRGMVAAW